MEISINEREYINTVASTAKEYSRKSELEYDLKLYATLLSENKELSQKEKHSLMYDFLRKHYRKHTLDDSWDEIIDKKLKEGKNYKFFESSGGVPITEKEMDTIAAIEDDKQEKLAFTLLVLAKRQHMANPENVGWVNYNDREIKERCNITQDDYDDCLAELEDSGLIVYPKKTTNDNIRVMYLDDGEEKYMITDFRNIGLQYEGLTGKRTIFHCPVCGAVRKYNKPCPDCEAKPKTKTATCPDCGIVFEVDARANRGILRCPTCAERHRVSYLAGRNRRKSAKMDQLK